MVFPTSIRFLSRQPFHRIATHHHPQRNRIATIATLSARNLYQGNTFRSFSTKIEAPGQDRPKPWNYMAVGAFIAGGVYQGYDFLSKLPSVIQACREIHEAVFGPSVPPAQKWINFTKNADVVFEGRDAILSELATFFQKRDLKAESKETKISALRGFGGIGKTQIALSYAKKHEHEYEKIIFIDCENNETFKSSLATLLKHLTGKSEDSSNDLLSLTKQCLAHEKSRYLLIIDNIDTKELADSISQILPEKSWGDVLITGRHPLIHEKMSEQKLVVEKLSGNDGVKVFKKLLQKPYPELLDKEHSEAVQEKFIIEALGGIPLAIRVAAGYFNTYNRKPPLTLADYSQILHSFDKDTLKAILFEDVAQDAAGSKTVHSTYAPHIAKIKDSLPFEKAKPMVGDVLYFLAFFGMLQEMPLPSDEMMGKLLVCFQKCSFNKNTYDGMSQETFGIYFKAIIKRLEERLLIEQHLVKDGSKTLMIHHTIKQVIHHTFLEELEDIYKTDIESYNESYQKRIFPGQHPKAYEKARRHEINQQKMVWLLGNFEYFAATIKNPKQLEDADLSTLISFIDFINLIPKKDFPEGLRADFVKLLNRINPISCNVDSLKKVKEAVPIEAFYKLVKAAMETYDSSGNLKCDDSIANALVTLGSNYANTDFATAEQMLLTAAAAGFKAAHGRLGLLYYNESKKQADKVDWLEKAKAQYDLILSSTQSAVYYNNRSLCYQNTDYLKAIADLEKAKELDPFNPLYYRNAFAIYIKSKPIDPDKDWNREIGENLARLIDQPEYKTLDESYKKSILKLFKTKHEFKLEENGIHSMKKDRGVLFGRMLNLNSSAWSVELIGCHLNDAGVESIANSLQTNKTLTNLSLRWNSEMTDKGIDHLSKALHRNRSLKFISLADNTGITPASIENLIKAAPSQLESITLKGCTKVRAKEKELKELAKTKNIELIF